MAYGLWLMAYGFLMGQKRQKGRMGGKHVVQIVYL